MYSSWLKKIQFDLCELLKECVQGLGVKAVRGNALLFYSLKPNGEPDPNSLHGSCPTLKGDKFSATKWVLPYWLTPWLFPYFVGNHGVVAGDS